MNRIVHFEFASPDPQKEVDFFTGVFGWTVEKWGEEDYWLVTTGEEGTPGINGAIMPQAMPEQPRVVDTVDVTDIDEAMRKAIAAGATVALDKQDVGDIGVTAYLISPTGIMFGLYQDKTGGGSA